MDKKIFENADLVDLFSKLSEKEKRYADILAKIEMVFHHIFLRKRRKQ